MTKEEFYSQVQVEEHVQLPYFTGKKRLNAIEETSLRVRALGGYVPNLPIYGGFLFMESQVNAGSQIGKRPFKFSESYNIYRQSINKADYAAKTNRLPLWDLPSQ